MADTMQFDLVSPERKLASVAVTAVRIPGAVGDLTAMPGHAPTITTLRPGIVAAEAADGESRYVVTGGFAEIGAEGVSVLAERGVAVDALTQEIYSDLLAVARKAAEGATTETAALLEQTVADMEALAGETGLSAS